MTKAIVFDLDGTLCKIGKNILQKNIRLLKYIENKGVQIIISSGKPTYYLCGLFRQVGLKNPILVGENGASIQFGINLPPKFFYQSKISNDAKTNIEYFKKLLTNKYPNSFFQPNNVGVTIFPKTNSEYKTIEQLLNENNQKLEGLNVYYHKDAIDIVPDGINKYNSLQYLSNILDIKNDEMISVGDNTNDYPMFKFTKISYGVNVPDGSVVTKNFDNINKVLRHIIDFNLR